MKNGDKPAYPVEVQHHTGGILGAQTGNTTGFEMGFTKREIFAMAAMQGILSAHPERIHDKATGVSIAVEWADELLKQLES